MLTPPPALPSSYLSAYVTYWTPLDRARFVSSGNVWFDYAHKCYRIDGLFNPWDVETTQQHLWMTELAHYGAGVSHRMTLLYDREVGDAADSCTLASQRLVTELAAVHEAILPQNYLQEAEATLAGQEVVLGLEADVWVLPADNRLRIRKVHLRRGQSHLIRMEQEKHGAGLFRDFPNFVAGPVDPGVFDPQNHQFARNI
jgi:anthraniloyl-CoA monooxygenase